MAFKLAKRTRQYVTTTGAIGVGVPIALATVTHPDLNSFVASVGDNNTTAVCVVSGNGVDWQECIVTVDDASPDTLTVVSIQASSIAGVVGALAITLVGTSRVFGIIPTDFGVLFNSLFSNSIGSILRREPITGWSALGPGADRTFLMSNGAGADLSYEAPLVSDIADIDLTGLSNGDSLFFNSTSGNFETGAGGGSTVQMKTWKEAAAVVTVAPLPNAPTYSNGTGGTGATLTATSNGALVIDGDSSLDDGHRILVNGQTLAEHNGIYVLTQGDAGTPYVLTRATDFNGDALADDAVQLGDAIQIYAGNIYGGTIWIFYTSSPPGAFVFGTSTVEFAIVGGKTTVIQPNASGADYDIPVFDATLGQWIPQRPAYPISFSSTRLTAYTADQVIGTHKMACATTIPANFANYLGLKTTGGGSAVATGSTVISVEKAVAASPISFTQIGTLTIAAAGSIVTAKATTAGAAITFAVDDIIRLVAPTSPDATFTGLMATLILYRT